MYEYSSQTYVMMGFIHHPSSSILWMFQLPLQCTIFMTSLQVNDPNYDVCPPYQPMLSSGLHLSTYFITICPHCFRHSSLPLSSFTSLSNSFDVKLHTADALSSNIGLIFQKKRELAIGWCYDIWQENLTVFSGKSTEPLSPAPLLFLYSVSSLRLYSQASHSHTLCNLLSSSAVLV